jgi:hypothetical protein
VVISSFFLKAVEATLSGRRLIKNDWSDENMSNEGMCRDGVVKFCAL